jgi:hypothetical protein
MSNNFEYCIAYIDEDDKAKAFFDGKEDTKPFMQDDDLVVLFNYLGSIGWELVLESDDIFFLKRNITSSFWFTKPEIRLTTTATSTEQ